MILTDQQRAIIEHQGHAVVMAVAGAGKTSTLVEYAKARPKARLLYIVFNRAARLDSIRKMKKAGIGNIDVQTAHSLAFRQFGANRYELSKSGNFSLPDILQVCRLGEKESADNLLLAKHIQSCLSMYCNSSQSSLKDLDYIGNLSNPSARRFALRAEEKIRAHVETLIDKVLAHELPMVHDIYLKLWQLSKPQLPYTHLLFDEGQDANPVMLDVFTKQKGVKVIVGDSNQSIYRFRYAVDSLRSVNYPQFKLTQSFRFQQPIADLAMNVLGIKMLLAPKTLYEPVQIIGSGRSLEKVRSHAVLARTNLGLLKRAIQDLGKGQKNMYFEGDLTSYTFLSEGVSLYDVLNLFLDRKDRIRSPFLQKFGDYHDLENYLEEADDPELRLACEIVEEFGSSLFVLIPKLKQVQVAKEHADIIYATGHRCKGAEYDRVECLSDFMTAEKLAQLLRRAAKEKESPQELDYLALNEEINLTYVAVTRPRALIELDFFVDRRSALASV